MMGHWLDRFGMKMPALAAAIMIGSGGLFASIISTQWELYLVYGVMMGFLGHGALFSPLMANVIGWFEQRRGSAVGIVASGQTLAGVVWPPIFHHFNETIGRSEEHTSELQSLMRISYAVFCLKKHNIYRHNTNS